MSAVPLSILPVVLLCLSNVFMTVAWHGHLKFTDRPLWLVVLASWGIAFVEYCLAVPANRYGYSVYSPPQLKTIQEVITPGRVRGLLRPLPEGGFHAQPRRGIRADRLRRLLRVQGPVVVFASFSAREPQNLYPIDVINCLRCCKVS